MYAIDNRHIETEYIWYDIVRAIISTKIFC